MITIKILGSGCPNCQKLEANAKKAVEELNLKEVEIEHIYDIDKIIEMGVMSVPSIVINEQIKTSGRIPDVEEIKNWLREIEKLV
ncbi:MAG: thioredoxin family protein [Minisyncoccia bacterium]